MRRLFVNSMVCAVAIGSMTAAYQLKAQETDTPVVEAAATLQNDAMKICADGFEATRAMHAARIAIFNGDPTTCEQMLAKAHEALESAAKDKAVPRVKTDLIPINGSLKLAETFVPDEQAAQHIAKRKSIFRRVNRPRGSKR